MNTLCANNDFADLNATKNVIERYKDAIISLAITLNHTEESKKDELLKTLAIYKELIEKYGKDVKLVPIVNEKLKVAKNGQWSLS